jgi:GTPase
MSIDEKSIKRIKNNPIDDTGYTEMSVAIIGHVDAGKSSTVGVLTNPGLLDDGRGKARSYVFRHPHEHETGRTSDISYQYLKEEETKKIFTFIDLAGHEQHLRTTISGLSSGYPDMALVCISDSVTKMTYEHMTLAMSLNIPLIIAFTKVDFIPADKTAELIVLIKKKLAKRKKALFHVRKPEDLANINPAANKAIVPFVMLSNKTGEGVDILRDILRLYPKKEKETIDGFAVEHIYNITGFGTVVSGLTGQAVHKGDLLYLGPFRKGDFIEVKVKTLHNDYHHFVDTLAKGKRGCLCISYKESSKYWIRPGMILRNTVPQNICHTFISQVHISPTQHTTIKKGYQAFINCGMIKEPVKFLQICICDKKEKKDMGDIDLANLKEIDYLKGDDTAIITMKFMKNMNYLEVGQLFVFREGNIKGMGKILKLVN